MEYARLVSGLPERPFKIIGYVVRVVLGGKVTGRLGQARADVS